MRFVGDPVAAIIARDELTAFEALDLIDVEYEPLRTFADPEDSLAYPEPRIHDYGDAGNIHKIVSLRFGDVEQAFADADRVFEDTFFYQGNTHLPIEQHAAVAAKDPDGKLVLWSSTQTPHYVHRALAKALAMPAAHIRVIATPNGGGFGGKSDPFNHEIVVAKAALLLDRPGEDLPHARRGLLLPSRPPSGADAVQDRREARRHDHRHARQDAARRRRLRLVRRRQHLLHRRAADRHLPHPDVSLRRLPRLHQQAAVRPEARPRHAAEPLRPGDSARQDRRERSRSIPPNCASASSSSPTR